MKKMRKLFAIVMVAIMMLAVLIVPTVMSVEDYTYFGFTGNATPLWKESHNGANWTSAFSVSDLDGDKKDDVLVLMCKYNEATNTETATVIAKQGCDGTQLWEESVTVTGSFIEAHTTGDLDGDGTEDVLVLLKKYDANMDTTMATVIAKKGDDGTHLWEESVTGTESFISACPAGDLNGDGTEDVLVHTCICEFNTTQDEPIMDQDMLNMTLDELNMTMDDFGMPTTPLIPSFISATVIAKRGYDGHNLWNESASGTDMTTISAYAAGDLDGDGWDDVLLEKSISESKREWYKAITGDGVSVGYGVITGVARINESDTGVSVETATTGAVIAKRGYDGSQLWQESTNETGISSLSGHLVGDLDGDGHNDVLVQTITKEFDPATFTAIRNITLIAKRGNNGTHLWEESVTGSGWTNLLFGNSAGDLDGDGKDDVLVQKVTDEFDPATNMSATIVSVIAKRGEDGMQFWNESVHGTDLTSLLGCPLREDLDGDGKIDVTVGMGEYNETTKSRKRTEIAKRGYDGKQLWEESINGSGSTSISALPAGDLDGDGFKDRLVMKYEYDKATDTTKGTVIAKRGYDGSPLWQETVNRTGGAERFERFLIGPFISVVPTGDLDGDGLSDVLVHTIEYDADTGTTARTVIAKKGDDGTHLWTTESDGPIWVAGTDWRWESLLGNPNKMGPIWGGILSGSVASGDPTDLTGDEIVNILLGPLDGVYAV